MYVLRKSFHHQCLLPPKSSIYHSSIRAHLQRAAYHAAALFCQPTTGSKNSSHVVGWLSTGVIGVFHSSLLVVVPSGWTLSLHEAQTYMNGQTSVGSKVAHLLRIDKIDTPGSIMFVKGMCSSSTWVFIFATWCKPSFALLCTSVNFALEGSPPSIRSHR